MDDGSFHFLKESQAWEQNSTLNNESTLNLIPGFGCNRMFELSTNTRTLKCHLERRCQQGINMIQ